jgi:hypothetical protein
MWTLDNSTPYAAERSWTRDKDGVHQWIVAVKATFDVTRDGTLRLADVQPPPILAPEYHGEPGSSSLRFDSDLLAVKPCTDVILDAHAHCPGGKRSSSVDVSLRVADLQKTLRVYGDRVYYKLPAGGLTTSSPQPFASRAIRYELAFGGSDTSDRDPSKHSHDPRNPIGVGFAIDSSRLVHKPAPSVEYPGSDGAKHGPAGFGPIDAAWLPRRALAGTYDATWERTRKPLLPLDYNALYAASAPADQRPANPLRGGELVELLHLTPAGKLRFGLPRIYLTFTTFFGRRREEPRARMTSVVIQPEAPIVSVVWQSTLAVEPKDDEYLDRTLIGEKPYLT